MVNTNLLEEKIAASGLKKGFIVENLGISRQAFDSKCKNRINFRKAEMFVLCSLLGITEAQEKQDIFFANSVEL